MVTTWKGEVTYVVKKNKYAWSSDDLWTQDQQKAYKRLAEITTHKNAAIIILIPKSIDNANNLQYVGEITPKMLGWK